MIKSRIPPWEELRTDETRQVERVLRKQFQDADAYRYNSASIRVRVIDPRFEGKTTEERDSIVEPHLKKLPMRIQADIINLLTLAPGDTLDSLTKRLANLEFEQWTEPEL
jgi:hypothetical protein